MILNNFYVAWQKPIQRLCEEFLMRHTAINYRLSIVSQPIVYKFEKRCAQFICCCLNTHNCVIKNIALSAKSSSSSNFGDNYRYLSYKFNIGIHVWNLPLCKLYKCFDLYLSHNPAVNPDGTFIRGLCLFRHAMLLWIIMI